MTKKVAMLLAGALAVMVLSGATVRAQEKKAAQSSDAAAKSDSAAKTDAGATGNAENGKKLFMADGCYECHGTVGQGASQTGGARIGPPAISLEEMTSYVRHPLGQMPPYTAKVISDHDLSDIYAYLKAQPKPPSGKSIPLLNQ
jgi:ubiquinol-cytochrome c reductase cytochrome c subunit